MDPKINIMATSFVSKDSMHGFWIRDSLLQVICWGFVDVIDNASVGLPEWMKLEFREYIYNCSQGLFVGFTSLRLNDFLLSQKHIRDYNELISQTRGFFLSKGEFISKEEINDFQKIRETKREWIRPFETARAVKILDAIEDVVNDRITIKVSDKIDYEF